MQQLGAVPPARAAFQSLVANTTVIDELMETATAAVKNGTWSHLGPGERSDVVKQIVAGALRAANVCDGMISQTIYDYSRYVGDTLQRS